MVRRYINIYSIMLRNSLIRELSFKANFILWMLVEVLWFVGQIVFFSIIFGQVDRIGDWTKWEVVLLVATHQIIAQLFQAFFFVNVANIPELVRTGKLDSMLVLPIDSQFAAPTKQFGLDSVINAIVGAAVVCVSLSRLGVIPGPMSILLYLTAIGFGVAVHYSIMLSLAAVSFWMDHSSSNRGKHSGAASYQIAWSTSAIDAPAGNRFDDYLLPLASVLAFCPAPLLQRQLVNITVGDAVSVPIGKPAASPTTTNLRLRLRGNV